MKNGNFWLILEFIILSLIFIPTCVAFITGAPWVPTPTARVKKMLELGRLKPGDKIFDLGCGDGRIPHLAAKLYGCQAVGLELSPLVYFWARVRNFFLRSKAKFLLRDFRHVDLSSAHTIFFYLLPNVLAAMRPKFERELKPGTRIISYAFAIEGWTPVFIEPKNPTKNLARILIYELPTSINANGNEAKK